MKVKHGKAIEITNQLSPQAAKVIAQWIGSYTVIKNQKTRLAQQAYQQWKAAGEDKENYPVVNQQVAFLNQSLPFLKTIPSQIRRNAGAKWFEAHTAFLCGLRRSPKVRWKYKKRNCYLSSELFDVQSMDKTRCLVQIKVSCKQSDKGYH